MKALPLILALLATTSVTSAFAEGGSDRLLQRSEQLAQQRQQAQEALAQSKAQPSNTQAQAERQADKPAS